MNSTEEVLKKLHGMGAPPPVLDLVRWVGPRLEAQPDPEAFYLTFNLALAELHEGRGEHGSTLRGSLVRQPPRLYAALAPLVAPLAEAFFGEDFSRQVDAIRLAVGDDHNLPQK